MKRSDLLRALAALALAAAGVLAYWWARAPEATPVRIGESAPELQLLTLGSATPTRLSQFRGRPVLLAMFASDCPLCDAELPRIERLHREFFKQGLVVLGVGADPDAAQLARLVQRHGITFYVLHDPNGEALRQAFGTRKLPELYLIDPEGLVRAAYPGRLGDEREALREQLKRWLGGSRSGASDALKRRQRDAG